MPGTRQSSGSRRKVSQIRGVVTDQFEGLAMLVEELSGRWENFCRRDAKLEEKARSCLRSFRDWTPGRSAAIWTGRTGS